MKRKIVRKVPFVSRISRIIKKKLDYLNFKKEFSTFKELSLQTNERFSFTWKDRFPQLKDKSRETYFDHHYIYHLAWATRVLAKAKPNVHVDISSSLYFCSIVSSFVPVKFFDYRPPVLELQNLSVNFADLQNLPFKNRSIKSISCMHVVEHIGLGRYGDPLDPDGDLKAIYELKRVVAEGGFLLFVVPIGKPKIIFNAHRVYSYDQILEYFSNFELKEFALIPDNKLDGGLVYNPNTDLIKAQRYGCGCFCFQPS